MDETATCFRGLLYLRWRSGLRRHGTTSDHYRTSRTYASPWSGSCDMVVESASSFSASVVAAHGPLVNGFLIGNVLRRRGREQINIQRPTLDVQHSSGAGDGGKAGKYEGPRDVRGTNAGFTGNGNRLDSGARQEAKAFRHGSPAKASSSLSARAASPSKSPRLRIGNSVESGSSLTAREWGGRGCI
jgi:hypothetical protein